MIRLRTTKKQSGAVDAARSPIRAARTPALHGCVVACLLAAFSGGCGDGFANQTASLGRSVAGQRGQVKIIFINNTPHRAVFSFGVLDQSDRDSIPDVRQFGINDFDATLDGGADSGVLQFTCGRMFSVGSEQLLAFVSRNGDPSSLLEEALEPGVRLFSTDDGGEIDPVFEGSADAREVLLGVDFNCESLLIFRIETNDAGGRPFRVDFEVAPADSTR